jgi:hypothetical protein
MSQREVRDEVLSRAGRYQEVGPREPGGAAPLEVKDVRVDERRYIVCRNDDRAAKDAADRAAILAALEDRLRQGAGSLIGNRGFRKYLKVSRGSVAVDAAKVAREARFDGKWVLRTNLDLPAADVAVAYKQLWMVEDVFRAIKSVLETRPVYHHRDETIRGHVFCSFLALRLMGADPARPRPRRGDRDRQGRLKISFSRTETTGTAGKVFQAAGVALPPTVKRAA